MVYCICSNCNSKDIVLSEDNKYLICTDCSDKTYIDDLDIGFEENNSDEVEHFKCENCEELFNVNSLKIVSELNNAKLCSNCFKKLNFI